MKFRDQNNSLFESLALLQSDGCVSLLSAALVVHIRAVESLKGLNLTLFHNRFSAPLKLQCLMVPHFLRISPDPPTLHCVHTYLMCIFGLWLHCLCQETSHVDVFAEQIGATTHRKGSQHDVAC